MHYRADIDGLRAIAVVSVFLFHLGVPGFSGGYVGVDVFFVISGFLITSLIREDIDRKRFSIVSFYERRIRRILPALFVMLAVSLVGFWFLMMPNDYKHFGQSVFAGVASAANFFFWKDTGYFTTPAEATPMLHLWSLAVEEQFYVVFPGVMLLIARFGWRMRAAALLALGVLSFAAAALIMPAEPMTAFFFPHTRAWELMVGSLLAVIPFKPGSAAVHSVAGVLGLGGIAAATYFYDSSTPFPGPAAALPVLATGLLIWSGIQPAALTARLLSVPAVVYVGKISYPLYLWHFPLIAAFEYAHIRHMNALEQAAIFSTAFALAAATYHFLETPLRLRKIAASRSAIFTAAGVSAVVLAGAGLVLHFTAGQPQRFKGEGLAIAQGLTDRLPNRRECGGKTPDDVAEGSVCRFGPAGAPAEIVVWGDSHAEAMAPGIEAVADAAQSPVLVIYRHGCPPAQRPTPPLNREDRICTRQNEATLAFILSQPNLKDVVFISRWTVVDGGKRPGLPAKDPAYRGQLEAAIDQLQAAGRRVWLVAPAPEPTLYVPLALYAQHLGSDRDIDVRPDHAAFLAERREAFDWLADVAARKGARLLRPDEALCEQGRCTVTKDSKPYYYDDNHLTATGARAASVIFRDLFVPPTPPNPEAPATRSGPETRGSREAGGAPEKATNAHRRRTPEPTVVPPAGGSPAVDAPAVSPETKDGRVETGESEAATVQGSAAESTPPSVASSPASSPVPASVEN